MGFTGQKSCTPALAHNLPRFDSRRCPDFASQPTETGTYLLGAAGADSIDVGTYTLSVRDITLPTLSIADAAATEGSNVSFTVTLSAAAAATVTATWTASIETGDTAVAADLGATKTGAVEITAGDTDATITVATVEDTTVEVNETFTVTLSSPTSNAKLETDPTAKGTIEDDDATALSTDATLSDLSLGTGVTLSPAFASGTVTYTASVANSVDEVTVTPTTNHASATVKYYDAIDAEIADADTNAAGHQVALAVGTNTIVVAVTAEDDSTSQDYTVTVTRAAEMMPDDPPDDSADPPEGGFREGATDLPANDETTGVVEVDGFGARGGIHKPIGTSIDIGTLNDPEISTRYVFDTDWFAVELEAGRTYRIDMKGAILTSPGPNNYADPELTLRLPQINAIYDADGDYLLNTWGADESSAHHLFRVTFHAHAGGTYYIAASGESFEWGGYELRVIDITEDTD